MDASPPMHEEAPCPKIEIADSSVSAVVASAK